MVTQDTINRINELYRKSKAECCNNLRGTLDSIKIQNPDGSMIDVKKRHEEKMKRLEQEALENARKYGN